MHRSSTSRRGFALGAVALAAALVAPLGAQAEAAFPSKPITVIVPFAAGGTTDILARIVGQALGKELGQSVIIENRAGAGGNIGAQVAARAPADGYTLFMGTVGTHAINQSLYKKLAFDPIKDFQPLTRVAMVPNMLVVNPSRPYKNVKELIGSIAEYEEEITEAGETPTLAGYLERVTLSTSADEQKGQKQSSLMSIHSAKGLEFDYVFLLGLEDGIFPYERRDSEDGADMEEERRLAYVAITRARKQLVLLRASSRTLFGYSRPNPASRFLRDLPRDFPGFGLVMVSQRALLPMREHCRSLNEVQLPDGERRPWRWWDPELLALLLPELSPSQLDELFGAGQQIVLPAATGWTWYALRDGVLAQDARPLLAAAA